MDIETKTRVTLTEGDVRQAICEWVANQSAGDGPTVRPASVEIYTAGGNRHPSGFSAIAST